MSWATTLLTFSCPTVLLQMTWSTTFMTLAIIKFGLTGRMKARGLVRRLIPRFGVVGLIQLLLIGLPASLWPPGWNLRGVRLPWWLALVILQEQLRILLFFPGGSFEVDVAMVLQV